MHIICISIIKFIYKRLLKNGKYKLLNHANILLQINELIQKL